MRQMKDKILHRYVLLPYGAWDGNENVTHQCCICGKQHTAPRDQWVLLVCKGQMGGQQRLKLACKNSVWKSGQFVNKEDQND